MVRINDDEYNDGSGKENFEEANADVGEEDGYQTRDEEGEEYYEYE
ncbi:hypothetical protein SOVF_108320 [Spinacia oleracea]|nr:hypothetical protein SOVF_108320 [Spinacia oleracea]